MTDRSVPEARPGRAQNNVRLVVEVLRRDGPSSQAGIARATGLSRATVNNIVQKLRADGSIDSAQANGRESSVSLRTRHGTLVAVEVDSRVVRGSLFDFVAERRLDAAAHADREDGGAVSPAMVEALVHRLVAMADAAPATLTGVAVGISGPITRPAGLVAPWALHRFPAWRGVAAQKHLSERLGVPTLVENDANLAALAEWTWGAGKGCQDFMYVTCGEGIGGGLILDGDIYRGGTGLAGEIGHLVVEESGGVCFCGSRGCLSGFAAERAILAALERTDRPRASLAEVVAGAREGDAACQRVLFEAGRHLGRALATAARVMAPSTVAVGGVLATGGDFVFDGLQAAAEIANLRAVGPSVRFCPAELRRDEVRLGGLAAVLKRLDQGVNELAPWMLAAAGEAAVGG